MFGKKKTEEPIDLGLAKDRIVMKKMENNDKFARDLILDIKDGVPYVINFRDLPDPDQANKYLYFLIRLQLYFGNKLMFLHLGFVILPNMVHQKFDLKQFFLQDYI